MNHFSYPLTIVQINIFEEPQNIFPNQNPRPQTIEPAPPRIFNYRVPPWGLKIEQLSRVGNITLQIVLGYVTDTYWGTLVK